MGKIKFCLKIYKTITIITDLLINVQINVRNVEVENDDFFSPSFNIKL